VTEEVAMRDQSRASAEEPMEAPDVRVPMLEAKAETAADDPGSNDLHELDDRFR